MPPVKFATLIASALVMVSLVACGDGSSDGSATGETAQLSSQALKAIVERPKPVVKVPKRPPPKKVVVKVLKEGSGPPAKNGDDLAVHYVGISYTSGKEFEEAWKPGTSFQVKTLGSGSYLGAWEEGLVGMRVGGRRELIVPSKLAYNRGPLIYVIDLLSIE